MKKHPFLNMPVAYKAITGNLEVDETSRKVSGYLAAFNTIDSDRDVILPGAFAKSLQEHGINSTSPQKIAYVYMHEIDKPLGRFTELKEDEIGLYFEAEIDKIPLGDQVLIQYKSGTLNQHSIGFRYVWDKIDYDESKDAWLVREIKLIEGSVVTVGANENTPFLGMKSADLESHANQLRKDTEKFIKSFSAEDGYKLRQLIAKHISLYTSEPDEKPTPEKKPKIDYTKLSKIINQSI